MVAYTFYTWRHLGDHVILTGAVYNVKNAHPEIMLTETTAFQEVWQNNGDVRRYDDGGFFREIGRVDYGTLKEEKAGANGNVVEGFTKSLCRLLNIEPVPIATRQPHLVLSASELEEAEKWRGKVLINANCQKGTLSKGYPYWQRVVDLLKNDYQLVQIGGNLKDDLSLDLSGVEDMRGKTSIRNLVAMAYGCDLVISPPSSITNIAGAFGKRQIVLNASREADIMTDYPNTVHISHVCKACGYGVENGCVSLGMTGSRQCGWRTENNGRLWCKCQMEIKPQDIAKAVNNMMKTEPKKEG